MEISKLLHTFKSNLFLSINKTWCLFNVNVWLIDVKIKKQVAFQSWNKHWFNVKKYNVVSTFEISKLLGTFKSNLFLKVNPTSGSSTLYWRYYKVNVGNWNQLQNWIVSEDNSFLCPCSGPHLNKKKMLSFKKGI